MMNEIQKWAEKCFAIKLQEHQMERVSDHLLELQKKYRLSQHDFMRHIQNDPDLLRDLIDVITVNESYFFRDKSLFHFLENKILPKLIEKCRSQKLLRLNIWSAGCSRGEELYSIAILLHQMISDIKQWNIFLLGTDINSFSLNKAKEGFYSASSLRSTSDEIKNKYFTESKNKFTLNENIRSMCHFEWNNLAEKEYPNYFFDIIFCRNVLIYMSSEKISMILNSIHDHLSKEGYLFLGPSDFIHYNQHEFKNHFEDGVTFYSKKELDGSAKSQSPVIEEHSFRSKQEDRAEKLQKIYDQIDSGKYSAVLKEIDRYIELFGESALLYRYKAEALIHLGDTATALVFCQKSIQSESFNPVSYYLKGLIEMDSGDEEEAEKSFEQALSMKSNFPEANYQLGLLLMSKKNEKKGLHLLKNALDFASKMDKNKKIIAMEDETMHLFCREIERDIAYYQGKENDK